MNNETQTSSKNLDPSAQEFHPKLHYTPPPLFLPSLPPQLTIFFPPPPPPPPLQLPLPPPPQILFPCLPPPPLTFLHSPPQPNPTTPHAPHQTTNTPSRSLLLSSVPPYATTNSVEAELNTFGEIRAIEMDRVYDEGLVTVHFYDLRDAQNALRAIRRQHFHGCPVWAQFLIPDVIESVHDGYNHGTIAVFNLDPRVPDHTLKRIFFRFGQVKEVRDAPSKRNQKFVEYYNVRDAENAVNQMNGKIIHGKKIFIDFSRPCGNGRRWYKTESDSSFQHSKVNQPESKHSPQPRKPVRNICALIRGNACPTGGNNGVAHSVTTVEDSMASSKNAQCPNVNVLTKNVANKLAGVGGGNTQRWTKGRKALLSRFTIKEDVSRECSDLRTTVMIKNVPNKYSLKLMLSLLDNHCAHCNDKIMREGGGGCLSSYDFVYLPMDFKNKCNVGYGFVNMTSAEATVRLYKAFHRQSWEVFNSRKICEVTYARVQGLEALKKHFRTSIFPTSSEDIYPLVFEPPRDGRRQLTAPQPVYCITGSSDSRSNSFNSSRSNTGSDEHSNDQSSADVVEEELLKLRVVGDVTEVGETQ